MPIDHFDFVAGIYDRYGKFSISGSLFELLALSVDDLLLDIGGGTGRVAAALQDHVKEVLIVDTSLGMLKRCAGKGLPAINAQAESLPIPSNCMKRLIMVDVFHHVIDQRITVHELWRVLAPGGRIVIVEPDIHRPAVKLIALGEKLLLMRSNILSGEKIAGMFEEIPAKANVYYEEMNVVVVVEKTIQ